MLIDGDLYSFITIFVFYSLLIEKKESKNNKVQQLASNIFDSENIVVQGLGPTSSQMSTFNF